MQKLFENWREFRKDTLNEAKNVEYIGAFTLNDSPFLRQMYIVDGQAYYTSAGTGGVTRKGDLVQFGGILEVDVVPGPDGGNIATRLHRDQYISQIRKGGQSFGEVYRADWVLKNPAGKDVGDLSQDIRNLEAEKKGRIINKDDINKLLKKRGILRADWAVQHGLRHIDFPGVTKVKPRARPPSGLNRRERAKWRKDRHDKEWRDRAKGWDDDSLYPEKGFKKNDPKVQKLIDKELRLLGELPPEKTFKQFIIKYGTKIPIIGRFLKIAFATTIGSMVLLEAEKAYAKEGPIGAMKVIADNGADFLPVIGDIKGAIEILSILSQQDWNVPDELKHVRPDVFFETQKTKENKLLFENWREYINEGLGDVALRKKYESVFPVRKDRRLVKAKILKKLKSLKKKVYISAIKGEKRRQYERAFGKEEYAKALPALKNVIKNIKFKIMLGWDPSIDPEHYQGLLNNLKNAAGAATVHEQGREVVIIFADQLIKNNQLQTYLDTTLYHEVLGHIVPETFEKATGIVPGQKQWKPAYHERDELTQGLWRALRKDCLKKASSHAIKGVKQDDTVSMIKELHAQVVAMAAKGFTRKDFLQLCRDQKEFPGRNFRLSLSYKKYGGIAKCINCSRARAATTIKTIQNIAAAGSKGLA